MTMQFTKAEKELITKLLSEKQQELSKGLPNGSREEYKQLAKDIRAISNIRIKVNHKSH